MKYVFQLLIIVVVSFVGEVLAAVVPLPIPASIYGLVIMLICLLTGIIKLSAVEETADFLVAIMPVMFIPAAVGLIGVWGQLKQMLLALAVIVPLTTVIVMAAAGVSAQKTIDLRERQRK